MSDSRVAGGLERLPWLADEPAPTVKPAVRRPYDLAGWAVVAVLLVAGVSFWLGSRNETGETPRQTSVASPASRVAPGPRSTQTHEVRIAPLPQVVPAPAPLVRQAPAPEVRIVQPAPRKVETYRTAEKAQPPPQPAVEPSHQDKTQAPAAATRAAPAPKAVQQARLTPWPPRVIAGAYGRLVQIGAYGSPIQAKRGWWSMVRAYPAVAHLPAVVVETRNSHGRLFYRFQVGTTSQAHSEVLCQRIRKIELSCAVVGLPWKSKVER
jgi:hypothetical protein